MTADRIPDEVLFEEVKDALVVVQLCDLFERLADLLASKSVTMWKPDARSITANQLRAVLSGDPV